MALRKNMLINACDKLLYKILWNMTGVRKRRMRLFLELLRPGGTTRILYMNTCDRAQVWTTPNCATR